MVTTVRKFQDSAKQRVFSLAFLDGAGTGIQNVLVGVVIAQRFGLAAAGLVLGIAALGRFGSPFVFSLMDRHPSVGSDEMHRLFRWAVIGMTATSLGVVAAAVWAAPWVAVAIGLAWALCNSVSSIIATSAVPNSITGFGPVTMVGVAAGAWAAALVADEVANGGLPAAGVATLAIILLAQLVEIPLIASVKFAAVEPVHVLETARHAGKGLAFAALAYGPIVIYPALTLKVASVSWVGWAMVVYAAGALAAIPLSRRLTGFHTFPGVLLLGAVGIGMWMLAFNGPALLATRFISGLVLFIAQGRLLNMAYGGDGQASTARLAGVSTGLGVGASIGAVVAAELADTYTVAAMAAILAVATLAAAAGVRVLQRARAARAEVVLAATR